MGSAAELKEKKRNGYFLLNTCQSNIGEKVSQPKKKAQPTRKTRKYRDEQTVIKKMYQLLKVRNLYKLYIKNHERSV